MSEWFKCDYCNGPADIEGTCPRCQQLAALEAEIGRTVIGQAILETDFDRMLDSTSTYLFNDIAAILGVLERAQWQAVARWRKLHAEGAEEK